MDCIEFVNSSLKVVGKLYSCIYILIIRFLLLWEKGVIKVGGFFLVVYNCYLLIEIKFNYKYLK